MKFLILLVLISAVFATEYEYVGKQACYNHCEHFYKGETQAKCFDKCSRMLSDSEKIPKKELCLIGCSMLKGWKKELCEVACNQIKADSDFFGPQFEKLGKQVWSQAKKFMKSKKTVKPTADAFPKKELCLLGCKAFKKDWQRQLCEIACNQIKESADKFNFKKLLKQGLKLGAKLGKEYLKKQIPLSEGFPKKELCLIGCKALKKDWQRQLCEIACNQIKEESDSEFLGKKFKKAFGKAFKSGLKIGKKFMKIPGAEALVPGLGQLKGMSKLLKLKNLKDIKKNLKMIKGLKNLKGKDLKKLLKKEGLKFGKKLIKKHVPALPLSEGFPKKELCLLGCKALKKDWQQQLCEIACNQIKESSDKFNFKKILKKGLKIGEQLGKEYLKKQIPLSEGFPKKELCLIGCKALKKDWQQQLCEIACNQIKESSDKINFKKIMKKAIKIGKQMGKEYLKKQLPIPLPLAADEFGGKPKPQPTPCQVCKSTCVRNQMNIGQCISKCDQTDCKLTPRDICQQKCIASQFNIPECMNKC